MNLLNKGDINNVSNNDILKSIFSYIDYQRLLKIIKNNNQIKDRLGISLDNYKDQSDMPKYYYKDETKTYHERKGIGAQPFAMGMHVICTSCLTCLFFIYSLVYTILLVSSDNFDESNSKENYDKSILETIKIINPCLFIFDALVLGSYFLFIFYLIDCKIFYGVQVKIKKAIIILIILAFIVFEGLVIWKLVLSYKIKKEEIAKPWFMTMDYLFIIFNGIYTIYLILISYCHFDMNAGKIITEGRIILKSFNNIEIENYFLPKNFSKWKNKEKKKYILRNYKNFKYNISGSNISLIEEINNFREKNNLQKFAIEGYNAIPDFIVQPPAITMIYKDQHIFKLSNKEYLLKYPIYRFESLYRQKDEDIISILSKNNLNHIQMITQKRIEYIYISEIPHYIYERDKFAFSDEEKEEKISLKEDDSI